MMRAAIIGLAIAITAPSVINAQQCGEAPLVSDQSLKGELEGKAKSLSGYLGEAGLKAQIESARTDVLNKYPNADRVRIDSYMLYMLCKTLLSDSKLTAQEKVKMMLEVQQSLRP
jgi:hypothetical protein